MTRTASERAEAIRQASVADFIGSAVSLRDRGLADAIEMIVVAPWLYDALEDKYWESEEAIRDRLESQCLPIFVAGIRVEKRLRKKLPLSQPLVVSW